MSRKVGVLRFPGTNCDRDIWQAVEVSGDQPQWLWYQDRFDANEYDAFILPGGFSYGDYLRSGALSAKAPAMNDVAQAAKLGKPVFGICNGFQILCEAGLLPGALVRNVKGRFIDQMSELTVTTSGSSYFKSAMNNETLSMPIAHADGCYYVASEDLKSIEENEQVLCRYKENPNGSVGDIAGVMNTSKNVVGMMPHPERALYDWMGSTDGLKFF